MDVFEAIKNRKSIRKYKDTPVPEDKLRKVIEAGRLAPSARNSQPWNFVIVKDPDLREKLFEASERQASVGTAPADIIIWTDDNSPMMCGQPHGTVDCSIAMSFMLLEAEEVGLGMCWLGHFDERAVKAMLDLPENAEVIAVTPVGYPDETPDAKPRKSIDEVLKTV